jgi:hypothetical protein
LCVKECPTENFAFVVNSKNDTNWATKMICKDGLSVSNVDVAEQLIDNNVCAGYYLKSKEGESMVCIYSVTSSHKLRSIGGLSTCSEVFLCMVLTLSDP